MCRLMKFELNASGIAETLEAERIMMFHWKLTRLWRYENAMIAVDMKTIDPKNLRGSNFPEGNPEIDSHAVPHPVLLENIHRAQKTAERGLNAAYKRLKSLQEWRKKVKLSDTVMFDDDGDFIV
jgi:hypothetical protein